MDIPLILRAVGDKRLHYGIPVWYRLLMGGIALVLLGGLVVSGGTPGVFGWIFIGLSLIAALYEEAWIFDAEKRVLRYRVGLILAARNRSLGFDHIECFRIKPYVRGTLPGSEDEKRENEAALSWGRGDHEDGEGIAGNAKKRSIYKKAYLSLVCECDDGSALLLNTLPVRRGEGLRQIGARIAVFCGKSLEEG